MLSVCLLARNAEAHMERVLRSVAPLEAEILVGDTGSQDNTVSLAQSLGARVVIIPWENDFAAAQNQVVESAANKWLFWINPDEELLNPGKERVETLLRREDALAYVVRVQEMAKADQFDNLVESWAPRLTCRTPELRYQGRLHPHFVTPLPEVAQNLNKQVYKTDLVVRRHGYLSLLTEEKLRWATWLLELELKDRPGQIHYQIEYGRNLLRLNDPQGHVVLGEASQQVMASIDTPLPPSSTVASLLEYLIQVTPEQSRSSMNAEEAGTLALRWFPNSPPLIWLLAQKAFLARKYEESATHLEKLVQLGRTGTYDHSTPFDPSIMREKALLNLGRCYLQLGDLLRSQTCFEQLLGSPSHKEEAQQEINRVKARRTRKD